MNAFQFFVVVACWCSTSFSSFNDCDAIRLFWWQRWRWWTTMTTMATMANDNETRWTLFSSAYVDRISKYLFFFFFFLSFVFFLASAMFLVSQRMNGSMPQSSCAHLALHINIRCNSIIFFCCALVFGLVSVQSLNKMTKPATAATTNERKQSLKTTWFVQCHPVGRFVFGAFEHTFDRCTGNTVNLLHHCVLPSPNHRLKYGNIYFHVWLNANLCCLKHCFYLFILVRFVIRVFRSLRLALIFNL